MDPFWIVVAFVLGFAVRQVGLPPLVGFLIAGFVLKGLGVNSGEVLQEVADIGVHLLLFSIGLKLNLRSLTRPEIWAGTTIHMAVTVVVFAAGLMLLSSAGLSLLGGLQWQTALLIAFALSFSSTVFAVKVLEDKAEMGALHGRVSIGILIMQDVIAIVFLTLSTGKVPSPWALLLLGSPLLRRPIVMLMDRSGHGELMVLFGILLTMGSAGLFELVGMKSDLGALAAGVLVGGHRKATEVSKALMGFKDLFLVGFFLNIGLSGMPSFEALGAAVLLVLVLPLKVVLFFWLMTRFKLRARTSVLGSLALANYSEFGLIVGSVGVSNGWLDAQWLVIIAIALSISFVIASPLNSAANQIYARFDNKLKPLERKGHHPDDVPIVPHDATILIFGMGRVGAGAYDWAKQHYSDKLLGLDHDPQIVAENRAAGRVVTIGDASDSDFWERIHPGDLKLVMLAMADHKANMYAARQLRDGTFDGMVAATAGFDDEKVALYDAGVEVVFNFYDGAGAGFADHAVQKLKEKDIEQW